MEFDAVEPIVREIGPAKFDRYAKIDPSYVVASSLDVVPMDRGIAGFRFVEQEVDPAYTKGADSPDDSPTSWPPRNESGQFAVFLATDNDTAVGGAAVIKNPQGAFLLERRSELAGLWDIRVCPDYRRTGIGTRLLLQASDWAKQHGCSQLRVESQNVNVAGCRFYAKHCILGGVERHGYAACPDVAHEAMLLWYREL